MFPTSMKHPHLNVNFKYIGDLEDIGFECKYREPFYNMNNGQMSSDWNDFNIYVDPKKPNYHWKGLCNLSEFVDQKENFQYLNIVQLIRNLLGLNKRHKNNKAKCTLVYLYCPSYLEDNSIYKNEINLLIL